MKAVTVLQPHAAKLALPESHELMRRAIPRTLPTDYRGPLAIYSDRSQVLLGPEPFREVIQGIPLASMRFGCLLAVAELAECLPSKAFHASKYADRRGFDNVSSDHVLILSSVVALPDPIYCRGWQGLWDVPELAERMVREQVERSEE